MKHNFKIGDCVICVDEDEDSQEYIGMIGVINGFFEIENKPYDVAYVKLNKTIRAGTNNNTDDNTRQFYTNQIQLAKNHIVKEILKDL